MASATKPRATEFTIPADADVQDILSKAREEFYKDPNVIGVGIGPRRVGNRVRPDEFALLVYVLQKLPEAELEPEHVIPDEFMGLKTDVIEPISPEAPKVAADYVHEHYLMHDMSSVDWTRLHELGQEEQAPTVEHAAGVQDFGDVCVIQNDGTLVLTAPNGAQYVDFVRGYQLFRTLHQDDYDFVTFFTDSAHGMPPQGGASFWSGIYNDVQGIGLPVFNNRATWGTSRLQGFHFLNRGHFGIWRYVMLQEFAHQWAAFVRYQDPTTNATMTDHLLNGVLGHWALALDDDRSPMDYDVNDWVELPNGQFRRVNIPSDQRVYCNLDLYLMGLLGPNEVGEFNLLRNIQPVPGSTTDFTATSVRLNIERFISQEGQRIPTVAATRKSLREAFIVLTGDIHLVHDLVEEVDLLRQRWEWDFREATKGLGQSDTVLDRRPGRITPEQIDELISGGYTNLHRHLVGPSDVRVVGTQFTGTLNPGQTHTWFTWGWSPAWTIQWALRPTTSGGRIRWNVDVERAGATLTYHITVTNVSSVVTTFEAQFLRLR